MDLGLQGKKALVTGSSRGLGFATALGLAEERMSGHLHKQYWKISTPSIPGYGINAFY